MMNSDALQDLASTCIAAIRAADHETLQGLIEVATSSDAATKAVRHLAQADLYRRQGLYTKALTEVSASIDLAHETRDDTLQIDALRIQGECYWAALDLEAAVACLDRSLELSEHAGDRVGVARALHGLGAVHCDRNEYEIGMRYLSRSLDLAIELDATSVQSKLYSKIGAVYSSLGENVKAQEYYHRAIDLARETGETDVELNALYNLSIVFFQLLDFETVAKLYDEILQRSMQLSDRNMEFTVRAALPHLALADGGPGSDPIEAERLVREFLALDHDERTKAKLAESRVMLAECLARQERYDEALSVLDAAGLTGKEAVNSISRSHYIRAQIHERRGEIEQAKHAAQAALTIAEEHRILAPQRSAHALLAYIARAEGDLEGYIKHQEANRDLEDGIRNSTVTRQIAMRQAERAIASERAERERERAVLYSTLPQHIAERVVRGEDVSGDHFSNAAVLFLDVVGFTALNARMTPHEVTSLLDTLFSICDRACAEHQVTRIKTIGDSYLAVAFPEESSIPTTQRAAGAALQILHDIQALDGDLQVRIGMDSGDVVAGVIGGQRLQYDVWGDTVNTASRMESTGEPGRIQVSTEFYEQLSRRDSLPVSDLRSPKFTERGEVNVKGKGTMTTYWLER